MVRKSAEKYPGQRNAEKHKLYSPYRLRVIADLYKRRFFEHFGNRCFKCGKREKAAQEIGKPPHLCMDHHIPMALGGHLVPGNIVSLCRQCNAQKLDKHPSDFYTQAESARLQPLLDTQIELFAFSFNLEQWRKDREGYLLSIGIDESVVHAALHDEDFIGYVGIGNEQSAVSVTITIDDRYIRDLLGR